MSTRDPWDDLTTSYDPVDLALTWEEGCPPGCDCPWSTHDRPTVPDYERPF